MYKWLWVKGLPDLRTTNIRHWVKFEFQINNCSSIYHEMLGTHLH